MSQLRQRNCAASQSSHYLGSARIVGSQSSTDKIFVGQITVFGIPSASTSPRTLSVCVNSNRRQSSKAKYESCLQYCLYESVQLATAILRNLQRSSATISTNGPGSFTPPASSRGKRARVRSSKNAGCGWYVIADLLTALTSRDYAGARATLLTCA